MAAREDIGMIDVKPTESKAIDTPNTKLEPQPKIVEATKKDMGHKPEFEIAYDSYT